MKDKIRFLSYRDLATIFGLSPVTMRKQAFDRRHGRPHWFTVDSVMLGSCPRYRAEDVEAWVEEHCSPKAER